MATQLNAAVIWIAQSHFYVEAVVPRPTVNPLLWEIAFDQVLFRHREIHPGQKICDRLLELLRDGLVSETADLNGETPRAKMKRVGYKF